MEINNTLFILRYVVLISGNKYRIYFHSSQLTSVEVAITVSVVYLSNSGNIDVQKTSERMLLTFSDAVKPVDLFTGSDVPEALQPKDFIPAAGGGPYSSKVKLRRVTNGPTGREPKYVFLLVIAPESVDIHAMSMACADFTDACLNHGIGMSRQDLKFMNTVGGSFIKCEEGHYQVRLPFRNQSLTLPANRCQAERRAPP